MESALMVILAIASIVLLLVLWEKTMTFLSRRWPCDCGRDGRWYWITNKHERGPAMLGVAIFWVLWNGFFIVLYLDAYSVIVGVPISCFWVLRWWRHEKDKVKKAARALGRVFVNADGRLRVAEERA